MRKEFKRFTTKSIRKEGENSSKACRKVTGKGKKTVLPANNYFKVKMINSPIQRLRLEEWIKINDPTICCLKETHLIYKDPNWK